MALTQQQKNQAYNREREAMDVWAKKELDYEKAFEQIYTQSKAQIEANIDRFYLRYADKHGLDKKTVKKLADKFDVTAYQNMAKEAVANHDFSKEANLWLSMYNLKMKVSREELLRAELNYELLKMHTKIDNQMQLTREKTALDEMKRQAGILGGQGSAAERLKGILNADFYGKNFSERVWGNTGLYHETQKSLFSSLSRIATDMQGYKKEKERLMRRFDVAEHEALRLLKTESARIRSDVQLDAYKKNGFTHYIFVCEPGACQICAPYDKERFEIGKGATAVTMPPLHPNCKCSTYGEVDYDTILKDSNHESLDKLNKTEYNQGMKESSTYARNVLSAVSLIEPRITSQLKHIAKQSNGNLQGLDFRLKSLESLSRKISTDSLLDEISLEEAANNINDALRYTAVFKPDNFFDDYHSMKKALVRDGFKIEKVKNTWLDDGPYNGVNTVVSKDNVKFEIQYHTQESFDLKNGKLHELYEERRLPNITRKRKAELDKMMFELSKSLIKPNQIERVD
ncbi:TPA: minor capsid protein [Streptococcus pyogenes]